MSRMVVFAPNWLGDAVMALPALADVTRASAAASVDVAASSAVAPLYSLVLGLGEIVTLQRTTSDIEEIRRRQYETALLLPNSFRSALTARRAGISQRWGYRADFRGPLLTRPVTRPARGHQVEYYQSLVRALGFPSGPPEPRLDVPPQHREAGARLLQRNGWDGQIALVALAPGAAYGGAKRWPASSFASLTEKLAADGIRAVLVGGRSDLSAGRDLVSHLDGRFQPIDLIGQTDLPTLAGTLTCCRALVSNDSGAMHVGAALGLQVTALFGPTRERETSPRGAGRSVVLTSQVWCRPCMLRECPLTHRCMRGIGVDVVYEATRPIG